MEAKSSDIIILVEGVAEKRRALAPVFEGRRIYLIGGETYVARALATFVPTSTEVDATTLTYLT